MALARFGGGVSELKGSIAGNVFSRSRAGAIVRNRIVPVNPSTPSQSTVRDRFHIATDAFKGLGSTMVKLWDEFAATQVRTNRLGETYVPSGKQLFTESSINQQLLGLGDTPNLSEVEADPNLANVTKPTVNITNTGDQITVLTFTNVLGSGDYVVVQATPQLVPSIRNAQRYYRQIFAGAIDDPLDLEAAYIALYGDDITDGNVIHFRIRAILSTNGFTSAWVYTSAVIPASV